jgi:putative Ca2+/H+ antiporter (TMEM165/GDT1 family)
MMHTLFAVLALVSLSLCIASPSLYVFGKIGEDLFKTLFLIFSISWFIFGGLWMTMKKKKEQETKEKPDILGDILKQNTK